MTIRPGTYKLGPENGTLSVRTGKAGAAAKAGHDLVIEVGVWQATLELPGPPERGAITVVADSHSLKVVEGIGGMPFGEKEKASATKSIDQEVLNGCAIEFRSTEVQVSLDGGAIDVRGELELAGNTRPLGFALAVGDDGSLTGAVKLLQTNWGMKPYSTLFGTLKVADEVEIGIDAKLD